MDLSFLKNLCEIIHDRKLHPSEGSYTAKLFEGGNNKIIKKLGEENAEFIQAFLVQSKDRIISEAADYLYHLIVALEFKDISFQSVIDELEKRHK
ncbi:MAG: phosphoribosyl-ATP diphosphatase [Deferribacteraceae bacterium]|jgi:phosphoribosyl-ATP pyrophosphohydrolase/phosphoribosyl-ATP pyrophosphohydrolase/phosphoribosyl-AMP cyclohydrolase|nr:phosphoribosyl-ATP diphosphatase [Deferribacteraceae bacterium]